MKFSDDMDIRLATAVVDDTAMHCEHGKQPDPLVTYNTKRSNRKTAFIFLVLMGPLAMHA